MMTYANTDVEIPFDTERVLFGTGECCKLCMQRGNSLCGRSVNSRHVLSNLEKNSAPFQAYEPIYIHALASYGFSFEVS